MKPYIPDNTPPDEYPDVPAGPGEPTRSVNWSSGPDIIDDDPHPDGPPPENPIYS